MSFSPKPRLQEVSIAKVSKLAISESQTHWIGEAPLLSETSCSEKHRGYQGLLLPSYLTKKTLNHPFLIGMFHSNASILGFSHLWTVTPPLFPAPGLWQFAFPGSLQLGTDLPWSVEGRTLSDPSKHRFLFVPKCRCPKVWAPQNWFSCWIDWSILMIIRPHFGWFWGFPHFAKPPNLCECVVWCEEKRTRVLTYTHMVTYHES